ncbi:MAG: hypothetical protein ABF535_08305 [Acetobacter sp.]
MLQISIVCVVLAFCVLYWAQRLTPGLTAPLWRGGARLLPAGAWRQHCEQRGRVPAKGGCGQCNGCDRSGGGCH